MKKYLFFLFCLTANIIANAQNTVQNAIQSSTQNIRGTVQDKVTKEFLIGATVQIADGSIGCVSDVNGGFVLTNVPLGRVSLKCQMLGYAPFALDDIVLTSTKEVFLEIALNTGAIEGKEVVISAAKNAFEAVNPLSVVSTRSFTAEETDRIPAGINDPGRAALSFPGVKQGPDETENTIIVRGNSPVGMLWRVEGIDIPNPNHFALIGSSVGGVNVFSAQLLARSDFSTGGMAAEYGNAISGAFDVHFRQGNLEKREHRVRIGVIGLDFATEGPIAKGKSAYVVNYRYSTLGLLNRLGFYLVGERVNNDFQDLSFNLSFKTKNPKLKITAFGIGGLSLEEYLPVANAALRKDSVFNHRNFQYKPAKVGALGTTFTYQINNKSHFKAVLALMGSDIRRANDTLDATNTAFRYHTETFTDYRFSTALSYNLKLNERIAFKTGLIAHQVFFDFERDVKRLSSVNNVSAIEASGSVKGAGNTQILQHYTQATVQVHSKLTANIGYHILQLNANNTHSLEPRLSLQYSPASNQNISFAYGLQGQTLPLMTYFLRDSTGEYVNKNLNLMQTHHFVAAYHFYTKNKMKLSAEAYYQQLTNVPVAPNENSNYWMLNNHNGYPTYKVVSDGKGTNYGIDIGVEKRFSNSYYVLFTGSVFQSSFQPFNQKTYNSRWHSRFSTALTGGKEFALRKNRVLQVGGRALWSGNAPYTPHDPVLSAKAGTYVPLKDADNTKFLPDYFRLDLRMQYRYNSPKLAGSISLDVQNVLDRINATSVAYDAKTNTLNTVYQGGGLIPVLAFQFDF